MPVIVEQINPLNDEFLRQQVQKLYDSSHEFAYGEQAIQQLDEHLAQGGRYYAAIFNQRLIGSIWAKQQATGQILLHYIVVHPANRGRGIADRLVTEACRLEQLLGHQHFQAGCGAIASLLQRHGIGDER
ncbi:MAG: GNAT family N-acetyltransferase [Acinetobacter sp.]|nr:GNAT family N-acetyltransferase [Acinetobacter sp.]